MTISFSLHEIVNLRVLQEIQDKFCDATGLAAVIVGVDGEPVTKPSNFTSFCLYIRESQKGLTRCMACDDWAGRRAMEIRRPYVYLCHSGLTDLAAPIIVNNVYMGAFLAGQVLLDHQEGKELRKTMFERTNNLGLDNDKLGDFFNKIAYVAENRVNAAGELMYILSNYIMEIGVVNITQKQLMSEMKAKAELENLLRAAEFKALQSQVNPHFLFNALNTISRLALLEGAHRTQEVVYALSDLLRNQLRITEQITSLENELKSISAYLLIQKARFGDRITTEINIPAELMQASIPVMTIQPIVENAFIHGLEKKKEGGDITITAELHDSVVLISVHDTGVGITPKRIKEIFHDEQRAARNRQTTGLGIMNVHRRLQHHFGNAYGIEIEGEIDKGTTVKIILPFVVNQ